jgi:drug/metabolite transporter (DMT)-like permease
LASAPTSLLPFAALLAGGAAIGFAPILVRWSDVGPVASAFWRLALAAPLLWWWVVMAPPRRPPPRGRRLSVALLVGLFFAGDLGLWHWSIAYTTVANATLLTNFAPIFVALGAWLLFRERLSRTLLIGMATALAGAVFLVGPHIGLAGTRLLGDALGVLTAVFYGSYLLAVKQARAAFSTATLMALSTTVSALVLLPVALLSPQPFLPASADGWSVVVALALVTQILGQGLIVYAFAHLPATMSSVSLLIQPVVAAVLAWWLFGEALGPLQFVGAALVLAGIVLARRATPETGATSV